MHRTTHTIMFYLYIQIPLFALSTAYHTVCADVYNRNRQHSIIIAYIVFSSSAISFFTILWKQYSAAAQQFWSAFVIEIGFIPTQNTKHIPPYLFEYEFSKTSFDFEKTHNMYEALKTAKSWGCSHNTRLFFFFFARKFSPSERIVEMKATGSPFIRWSSRSLWLQRTHADHRTFNFNRDTEPSHFKHQSPSWHVIQTH